jgi:polysaccharide export outer membrane protein
MLLLAALTQAAEPSADVGPDYLISPGDTLEVFVWQNPDLSVTVPVRPDGKISTRLVDDMVAVGKTPSKLARDIEEVLSEYIRSPQVNIIVTQPNSVFSQVKVIGEVGKPQSIPYREGLTVLDVVLQAGGLGAFAAGNRAHILRTVDGKQREIPVRVKDIMSGKDTKQNLPLMAGDILVVPQSRF